jgi:hypothetical protein
MKKVLLMIIALPTISLATVQAQDLAALARQTRANRMKVMQERSVRIWNNDNMPRRPAGEGPTAAGGMSPVPLNAADQPPPEEPKEPVDTSEIDSLRDQIKQSRQNLKGQEERLRLAEDELNLLNVQKASELAPETQATLATQINDKNAEVSNLRLEIDKAKKEIDKLEKDFKAQGGKLEEKK